MAGAHDIITNFTVPMSGSNVTTNNTYKTLSQYLDARANGWVSGKGFEQLLAEAGSNAANVRLGVSKYSPNYSYSQQAQNYNSYNPNDLRPTSYYNTSNERSNLQSLRSNSVSNNTTSTSANSRIASKRDADYISSGDTAKKAIKDIMNELSGSGMSTDSVERVAQYLAQMSPGDRADTISGLGRIMDVVRGEISGTEAPGAAQFYINALFGYQSQGVDAQQQATDALYKLESAIDDMKQTQELSTDSVNVLLPMLIQLTQATGSNDVIDLSGLPQTTEGAVNFGTVSGYQSYSLKDLQGVLEQVDARLAQLEANNATLYGEPIATGDAGVQAAAFFGTQRSAPQEVALLGNSNGMPVVANGSDVIPVDPGLTVPGYVASGVNLENISATGSGNGNGNGNSTGVDTAAMNNTAVTGSTDGNALLTDPTVSRTTGSVQTPNTPAPEPASIYFGQGGGEGATANTVSGEYGKMAADSMGTAAKVQGETAGTSVDMTGANNMATIPLTVGTGEVGMGAGFGKALVDSNAPTVDTQVLNKIMETVAGTKSGGTSQVEMTLNPDRLGKIFIKIVNDGGAVTVTVAAQNNSTLKMLEQRAGSLLSGLQENGTKVTDLKVITAAEGSAEASMENFFGGNNSNFLGQNNQSAWNGQNGRQYALRNGLQMLSQGEAGLDTQTQTLDQQQTASPYTRGYKLWQTV